jgi:signal transduction histidine kinase
MDPFTILVRICECTDADSMFDVFVSALREAVPVRSALRIRGSDARVLETWPSSADVAVSPELREAAAHVLRPEIFPIGSQFPQEAAEYHDAAMLLIPLRGDGDDETIVVITDADGLGDEVLVWEELASAMQQVRAQCRRLSASEEERQELRQRAEESEALHTLGLSANRTLNQDEVLGLVSRFTRSLLGAHYATVHTREGDALHLMASVGLRTDESEHADDALARRVVEAEKPVIVGGAGAADPASFPFHAGEGMKAGLGMPLALYGDTFGALVVGYRREYEVQPRDVRLAVTLAGHAAVAISNAYLHRTLEARARELDEAYSQLREVTRAKERFFNAISHDLRTPVSAIKGYSELMLEGLAGALPERAEKYIRSSYRASKSLLALVNDLMDFAKLEAGKLEVTVAEAQLGEVLEDALAAVQPQADAKGLRLAAPEARSLPSIRTDPRRLRQILVNLISNAVKFTDQGEVAVAVEALADRIEIQVRDTGRGIPVEDQARIFHEFEQVPGSEGTGLGLPISHKLADLLGGTLSVESQPDVGSTFTLTLPHAAAPDVAPSDAARSREEERSDAGVSDDRPGSAARQPEPAG